MSMTRACRDQHAELAHLMAELKGGLQADGLESRLLEGLRTFRGRLQAHLELEDRVLYPRLEAHDHEQVRLTAQIYRAEMGRLGADFEAFHRRWDAPGRVEEAPGAFRRELEELLARLDLRMKREDRGLYALVDRVESGVTNPGEGASQG